MKTSIRTCEEFDELNTAESIKFGKFLPVELAFMLPAFYLEMCGVVKPTGYDLEQFEKALNKKLEDSFFKCYGFDGFHSVKVIYSKEPIHTFAEAEKGIYGKPSFGVTFTDADDPYNDIIWVATDVLSSYVYSREMLTRDMKKWFKNITGFDTVEELGRTKKKFNVVSMGSKIAKMAWRRKEDDVRTVLNKDIYDTK